VTIDRQAATLSVNERYIVIEVLEISGVGMEGGGGQRGVDALVPRCGGVNNYAEFAVFLTN